METFNNPLQCGKSETFDTGNCETYRSDRISCNREKALMDVQESILNSNDSISNNQDNNSILYPIDLLGDMNGELNKNFSFTNQLTLYSQQHLANNTLGSFSSSWSDPSYIGVNASTHAQDIISSDSSFLNFCGANDGQFLLPEGTEFSNSECSFFSGDYTSSLNQLFQSLDQQQLSAGCSTMAHPQTPNFSDTLLNTIGSLPASTTITPISIDECHMGHNDISSDQQALSIQTRFFPESEQIDNECPESSLQRNIYHAMPVNNKSPEQYHDINSFIKQTNLIGLESVSSMGQTSTQIFSLLNQNECSRISPFLRGSSNFCFNSLSVTSDLTSSLISKGKSVATKNLLNWTAVFPRNHPEMIIMHPLRTRKLMASRKLATTIDLSDYFDTSSINIPVIRERPRSDIKKENRRKQKLSNIPGAEYPIFEVQGNFEANFVSMTTNSKLDVDPYPETELPELEEIFKRKKKITVLSSGTKRGFNLSTVNDSCPKKQCTSNSYSKKSNVMESSTSYEEKISVSIAIRQSRSKIPDNISDASETDSGETDTDFMRAVKSLKCFKCMKLFKTNRSLSIHIKRCAVNHSGTSYSPKKCDHRDILRSFLPSVPDIRKGKLMTDASETCYAHAEGQKSLNAFKLQDNKEEMKARPITRSQTRRSTYPRLIKRNK